MKTIKQLVASLDVFFFETSKKSYREYQELIDQLEALDPYVMMKVADRHAKMSQPLNSKIKDS